MKLLSPLITLLLLKAATAQHDIGIEALDDDAPIVGKSYSPPVSDNTEPCNGYPEYRDLPINQYFYYGQKVTTDTSIPDLLTSGHRYLDVSLCQEGNNDISLCSHSLSLSSALHQVFDFARDSVEQLIVLNVNSIAESVLAQDIEKVIDTVCKIHAEKTPGTAEYEDGECPFIYKYKFGAFPSIGSVVNYDPEMAQWIGDGELVGVRTKVVLTLSNDVTLSTPGYNSAYFTNTSTTMAKDTKTIMSSVHDLCKIAGGGIGIEAYIKNNKDENAKIDNHFIETLISSIDGCNINDSPLNSFINVLALDHVETKDLVYLKELEKRILQVNYAKFNGKYPQLAPATTLTMKDQKIQRDEL
ncbi:hypothetical protein K501DRAFT_281821 [Backusella circina FSU 941]|nr:hypothetical protein K501DRAFT_281821 [Backusella circina FSU 941]